MGFENWGNVGTLGGPHLYPYNERDPFVCVSMMDRTGFDGLDFILVFMLCFLGDTCGILHVCFWTLVMFGIKIVCVCFFYSSV